MNSRTMWYIKDVYTNSSRTIKSCENHQIGTKLEKRMRFVMSFVKKRSLKSRRKREGRNGQTPGRGFKSRSDIFHN